MSTVSNLVKPLEQEVSPLRDTNPTGKCVCKKDIKHACSWKELRSKLTWENAAELLLSLLGLCPCHFKGHHAAALGTDTSCVTAPQQEQPRTWHLWASLGCTGPASTTQLFIPYTLYSYRCWISVVASTETSQHPLSIHCFSMVLFYLKLWE